MAKSPPPDNTVCRNRKALHRFEILERIECGVVLRGGEVKSLRERDISIDEAYVRIVDGELWLIGCHITPYRFVTTGPVDPLRKRKLLARAQEIRKLQARVDQKGRTLVPLRVTFNRRGIVKVVVGVARGKRSADKRSDMKAKDHQREIDRAMRRRG